MSHFEERALAGEGTTLLTPTVRQDNMFGERAARIYRTAMCRDNDRPQRVKLLTEALEAAPEFREAYFWRGILNFVDVQQNIADLQRALNLTPLDSCQALVIQSQICAMSRNPEKAVIILSKALELAKNDGDIGEIYYFRAFANWWIDKDEDAFEDCRKAINNNYNVKSCYTHLADMARYMNKSHEEIQEFYRLSLLPTPRYTELVKYAIYLKKKNRKEDALAVLEEAIQRNSLSPDAYEERASITYSESDYITALQLDTHAKLIQCRRMYAAVLADRQQKSRAIQVLTEGIKVKPRAEWYCLRGQLRIEFSTSDKERLKGCADLRKAVQLNPSDPDLQFWLGKAISRIRGASLSVEEGIQRGRNALHLTPTYPRINADEAQRLKGHDLPIFKFFANEAEGMYLFAKRGTAYQYAVTTRKVVCLLADFACEEEELLFKLFKRYSEQLYMWSECGKLQVSAAAERSLDNLWKMNVPEHILHIMKKIQIMGQISLKNFPWYTNGERRSAHELIVLEECDNVRLVAGELKNGNFGDDVFVVFVHYAYRKPISVTREHLEKVILFAQKVQNKKFEQFLMQYVKPKEQGNSPEVAQQQDPKKEEENQEKEQKKTKQVLLNFQRIPKDLSKFVNDQQFSDIVFHFPTENKEIWGNRLILSANCPYFARMLNSGLRESKESQIVVNNMSYEIWHQVMVYCYGGKVQFTPQNCVELLQVADEFGLPKLKILCELYIGQRLDADNVNDIEQIATIYNAPRLKTRCEHEKIAKVKGSEPLLNLEQTYEMVVDKN